ncbi:salivary cysteine-rich peptide precursor [Bombyx mori]|uniref:Salivary cysteine-rich peptide n=1 Tax=Bombyx mori TaxID=7091 RepID=Q2F5L7_BOMMO|nr:salivary cysteine-rich peptide precursor [Bombyx mori]ABD36350.1 salivary cysteine-rich peptide [Bombyx mori]
MGSMTFLLGVFALVTFVFYAEAAGTCPLPSKVYGCSPKCKEDYECTHGKVCCSNSCNAKSCSEPAAYGGGTGSSSKHATGGTGVYCENVKCNSYEICKRDPITKRMKCSRA